MGSWLVIALLLGVAGGVVHGVARLRAIMRRTGGKFNEQSRLGAYMRGESLVKSGEDALPSRYMTSRSNDLGSPGKPQRSEPAKPKRAASEEERFREFLERGKKE